jgi:hypothetical protein
MLLVKFVVPGVIGLYVVVTCNSSRQSVNKRSGIVKCVSEFDEGVSEL